MTQFLARRDALKLAALGVTAALNASPQRDPAPRRRGFPPELRADKDPFHGLKVGLTSYSTRMLMLEPSLKALQFLGVRYISLKDMHLPLSSTTEERAAAKKKIAKAGLEVLGCGVISLKNDGAQIRHALEYAKEIGSPVATIAPDPDALPALNKVAKEFDILLAIHNHGPEDKKFPSPYDVLKAIDGLDQKIGCCVDVGHTLRAGVDPLEALRKCGRRLYGIHIKDIADSSPKPSNVPLGQGVLDIVGMLRYLVESRFQHLVALEYEAEPDSPVPGMSASFGYLRGALAAI
jgi:inosose dehydratase